jgi:hypothetical protein
MRGGVDQTFTLRLNTLVKVSADTLANAMADLFREIVLPIPDARVLRKHGVIAAIIGVPLTASPGNQPPSRGAVRSPEMAS